jgi:hypothetical protein
MAESGNFNRLVSGLPLAERQNLLEKLKGQSNLSSEPLYVVAREAVHAENIEAEYVRLPWYSRLWYFILSFIKSREPSKIYEDYQVSVLGTKIEEHTPGLYDYQSGMLLPLFFRQMGRLKEAAHFFYSALDAGVNRDRGSFFAFLGSLEMPDVHQRLQSGTEPDVIAEKHPDKHETELRQIALKTMDDAFALISEDHRLVMYSNARSLFCLKELASFLYDRVLMAFSFNSAHNGEICSAGVLRDILASLNNILFSLKVVPSMTLLESLFVFIMQEKSGEQGFNINMEIHSLLTKAENSLAVIREFNKQVPLTWILRCATRKMALLPVEISGGEDWFVFYRDYWKRRADSLFADYTKDRRQRDLLSTFRNFLKGQDLKILENTQTEANPDGMPIKGAFALSFLYTFYASNFMPDINWVLRPILIDGDFKHQENRLEFTESYNNIIKLEDEIRKLEGKISLSGDYGQRYSQARQEMTALPVKRRKIQIIVEEAEEDTEKIVTAIQDASLNMVNILNGILGREERGKYDTLTNLPKIVGKDNSFIAGLVEAVRQFETVHKILDDIEAMESEG